MSHNHLHMYLRARCMNSIYKKYCHIKFIFMMQQSMNLTAFLQNFLKLLSNHIYIYTYIVMQKNEQSQHITYMSLLLQLKINKQHSLLKA